MRDSTETAASLDSAESATAVLSSQVRRRILEHLTIVGESAAKPAGGSGPVSYTHLRAHETVLDHVCRLLLAKKKTRDHNNHNTDTRSTEQR